MNGLFKIGILVCACFFVYTFHAQYSEKKELEERQMKIELLKSCTAKFQYQNEYYAACPFDKFIDLNYAEYVGFDATTQDVPDQFKSDRKMDPIFRAAMLFAAALVAVGTFIYIRSRNY